MVIDRLSREPLALAAQLDGSALAIWKDGTARTYWPNGRSLDELLPVRYSAPAIAAFPRHTYESDIVLFSRPFYTVPSPYATILEPIDILVPWEDSVRGEPIPPWLLSIFAVDYGWAPIEPHYHGKAPAQDETPFEALGCVGGGAVILEDGHASMRLRSDASFTELATRALLPRQTTLIGCERFGDALHVVMDIDSVPLQARQREMRLTEDGLAEIVARREQRVRPAAPPAKVVEELRKVKLEGDMQGCEAGDDTGVTLFAWMPDEEAQTVLASYGDNWFEVAHFEGKPKFACQVGGRGLFVFADRGLYLVRPVDNDSASVTGEAPRLLGARAVRLPRVRSRAGFSSLKAHPATLPSRLQLTARYAQIMEDSSEQMGQGGPTIRFTNENLPLTRWEVILALQWNLGKAPPPYSPRSDDRSRLESVTAQLSLTNAVASPVAVYPGPIQRRASQEVWDALEYVLRTEEF